MSSDPIEAMFGFLHRSAGCNDMLDIKSAVCGLEKMLKTGIVAASSDSNVQSSTTFSSRQLLPVQQELHVATSAFDKILKMAAQGLKEHCLSERTLVSNPDVASVDMICGYIVRAANRGGLFCRTQELVKLLIGLRMFVDCVLPHGRSVAKPLELCVQRIVRELVSLPVLTCGNTDADHRRELLLLITGKFIRPLFSNFAQGVTDRNAAAKLLERKPLSRKVLKL
ncbi:hypothetical protein HPB49_008336 [Dermacentor silvarum]|uniref:Uncharacterized protein n=1 Tax=Dermacentor silvarum TaxID=543639 RepID=A0ACB8C8B8_DERSI|nr:hypothetical protein HPB49_008336 [Dermacentor silvarum]